MFWQVNGGVVSSLTLCGMVIDGDTLINKLSLGLKDGANEVRCWNFLYLQDRSLIWVFFMNKLKIKIKWYTCMDQLYVYEEMNNWV